MTKRDDEIPGMSIAINAIASGADIPDCMTTGEIRLATLDNEHLCILSEYILCGWPPTKPEVPKEL